LTNLVTGAVQHLDIENVPTKEEMHDLDKLAEKIAKQEHNNGGKLGKSYHAITRGWYLNEIVRRVTDKKLTNGKILHEHVNPKLGIDIYCGIPEDKIERMCQVHEHPGLTGMMAVAGANKDGDFYKVCLICFV
jgi:hypothetical protein